MSSLLPFRQAPDKALSADGLQRDIFALQILRAVALQAVASIETGELAHLHFAASKLAAPSLVEKVVSPLVSKSTYVAIWLSERL